jgi:putative phage-type endonuclease
MKIIEGLQQGSPDWLEFRRLHIGASDAATIMGLNPWHSKLQLWQEKTLGWTKEVNNAMRRGTQMEEQARKAYELHAGFLVCPMVVEDDHHPFISASLDGISIDLKKIVEIKCGKASHKLAQHGEIPKYYLAQCAQQMYVAGVNKMDYWSFDGTEGILIPVVRDNQFITTLLEKLIEFWDCVQSNTPPKD